MENLHLFRRYSSEKRCINLIKNWRDKIGVVCKRCYGTEHHWISSRCRYRCKACKWETTLRSGTAMECSKLPYMYWVYAAILLSNGKKPISAKELQQLLGHKYYVPIWSLLHKLRISMGFMSSLTGLAEFIRLGEVVIPVVASSERKRKGKLVFNKIKGIRVSLEASNQVCSYLKQHPEDKGVYSQIRMISAIGVMHSPTDRFGRMGPKGHPVSRSEASVSNMELVHQADLVKGLKWFQSMALNARRNFTGIYHSISEKYFQNYLAEFCFLTNRRNLGPAKFDSLLELLVRQPWHQAQVQFPAYSRKVFSPTLNTE